MNIWQRLWLAPLLIVLVIVMAVVVVVGIPVWAIKPHFGEDEK